MTRSAHSLTILSFSSALQNNMVLQCFRNSMLEDLYAGTSPSSASGDYSDVAASTPQGVIPWPKVSRLNDDGIKRFMMDGGR